VVSELSRQFAAKRAGQLLTPAKHRKFSTNRDRYKARCEEIPLTPAQHAAKRQAGFLGRYGITDEQFMLQDDHAPEMHWVAAESLDAALVYLRKRHDDFVIKEARFRGMIPLLSGSPLD